MYDYCPHYINKKVESQERLIYFTMFIRCQMEELGFDQKLSGSEVY